MKSSQSALDSLPPYGYDWGMERTNYTSRSGDDVVRYIAWHWKTLNYNPSIRDIGKAIGIASPACVHRVLVDLERQGRITRDPYKKTVRVVNGLNPETCEHDWRVVAQDEEILTVLCQHCKRKTEVEWFYDPDNPETWLRFMGEVGQ